MTHDETVTHFQLLTVSIVRWEQIRVFIFYQILRSKIQSVWHHFPKPNQPIAVRQVAYRR